MAVPSTMFVAPTPGSGEGSRRWKAAMLRIRLQRAVIIKFGRKFSARTVPCSIATAVQQAQFLQENNAWEVPIATNQHAGSGAHPSPGAPFSPGASFSSGEALKDKLRQKKLFKKTPNDNGQEPLREVHYALPGNWQQFLQFLQWALFYEILNIADIQDHPATVPFTTVLVTVITLAPESHGIKAIIDRPMRSIKIKSINEIMRTIKKLFIFICCFGCFEITGANAQDHGEGGGSENAVDLACTLWTVLVGLITFTAVGWIINWVQAVPPPAPALPAVPVPAVPAVPAPAPAVPAPVPAVPAPAPAVPAPVPALVAFPGVLDLGSGALRRSDPHSQLPDKFPDMDQYF